MKGAGSGRVGRALRYDIIIAACFAAAMALLPLANMSNYLVGQFALFFFGRALSFNGTSFLALPEL